ncbi:hypothetical protein [Zobellia alginiliquefaciens]|uniref:hypothetical protein n=1 Tax=Zobellia alginiliquefaciens TaxID=3032586 RepID=UPI0023E3E144|nr:hypothetical protein [Zobellia alginiliquefaciens]
MGYNIKGNLRACLYLDIYEALDNVQVLIYKVLDGVDESNIPKNQLLTLSENAIAAKEKRCLGTGFTDEDGNFGINICDLYDEGAIEIDLVVSDKLTTRKKRSNRIQFTARRLNPIWRNNNEVKEFSWNYSFNFQFWSQVRQQFDIWTILGSVKSAADKNMVIDGVVVSAIDVDWVKDDFLGSAVSDSNGQFRIDYKSIDFKKTYLSPLLSIETPISSIPGPGVYFKITTSEGILLYEENRAMGKTQERRNIPRCFIIDLYI